MLNYNIHDIENELSNQILSLNEENNNLLIERYIVEGLKNMLNVNNEIVKTFRVARNFHKQYREVPIRLRLIAQRKTNDLRYYPPTCSEIAGLIVGDFGQSDVGRNIIVQHREQGALRINDLHPLFMSMQYPLLFPYGEDGFSLNIPYIQSTMRKNLKRDNVTMKEYYAYLIQQRNISSNTLIRGGCLFQQFLVDAYAIVEESRLRYIKDNKKLLRTEMYKNIRDAISGTDMTSSSIGKWIVLPASFTRRLRYMFQNYQDALAICRYVLHYSWYANCLSFCVHVGLIKVLTLDFHRHFGYPTLLI